MQGITTKTYLTRSLLNRLYKKKLKTAEIEDLVISGELIKIFSYYQPSESLLRKLKVIPNSVGIVHFNVLAKKNSFVLKELMEIFDCNVDTAKIIAKKYFIKKWNYHYKNDILIDILTEGKEVVEI